ncbi:MAG TPA: histidinol dehydrogenase [Nitrososphaeraceae archaeon]|nr:histidinol dehydrogenase [Nitrososphaeraceae archaeon]
MIKTIIIIDPRSDAAKLRNSISSISDDLFQKTKLIMDDVAKYGDSALFDYTEKFDGVRLNSLKVTDEEIKKAYNKVTTEQVHSIKIMKERLIMGEKVLLKRLRGIVMSSRGVRVQRIVRPVSSVGCYIPGGKARYPSTMVMCAIPAKVAGVKRVVALSPPLRDGTVDPLTLVAADICDVDEFYKVGGAHGIMALAFGTPTISKVSKIVGPGGIFVTIAKILASSKVSIDMIAGPTELLIYADSKADPKLIAFDLISQSEHSYDTLCGLVTTSKEFAVQVTDTLQSILEKSTIKRADIVKRSLEENGFIAVCKNESAAVEFINELAPEHLEIIATNARTISKNIISAGLVLIGKYTPSSASDYCLGSNHVLPTSGFSKSRASLSVLDFVKIVNTIQATKQGLKKVEPIVKQISMAEGLTNHYEAIRERFKK